MVGDLSDHDLALLAGELKWCELGFLATKSGLGSCLDFFCNAVGCIETRGEEALRLNPVIEGSGGSELK